MKKSESKSCRVMTFLEVLEQVLNQVEAHAFEPEEKEQVEYLCRVIAEIYCLPKDMLVTIDKNKLAAKQVAAAYSLLKHENIEHVLLTLSKINYRILHPKTYLRTALYNSVFESATFWANMPHFGGSS